MYYLTPDSDVRKPGTCITAIRNWSTEILNSFEYPYTNGYTEGTNNKIKVIKRNAFGMRDFSRFRNRILMATGNMA